MGPTFIIVSKVYANKVFVSFLRFLARCQNCTRTVTSREDPTATVQASNDATSSEKRIAQFSPAIGEVN